MIQGKGSITSVLILLAEAQKYVPYVEQLTIWVWTQPRKPNIESLSSCSLFYPHPILQYTKSTGLRDLFRKERKKNQSLAIITIKI